MTCISRYTVLLGIACFADTAFLAGGRSGEAEEGITAAISQPVHPVLIRKEHNELLELVLDVKRGGEVRLKSISCSLEGTDDLGDLESLQFFAVGEEREIASGTAFGEPVRPAAQIAFQGDQPLGPGINVFWLSARLKPSADLGHRVDAACTSVVTSGGRVAPRDESPGVRRRIGVALRRAGDDGVHTYRIPALTRLPDGTLLCAYDMRRRMSRDLQADIDVGVSRSTDGGRTWEPPRVVMDMGEYGGLPQDQNGCGDPGIIVDPQTGEIFVFAAWMSGKPGQRQWHGDGSGPGYEIGKSSQFMVVRSRDGGLTWTNAENLTSKLKQPGWWLLVPSPQQGIALSDGTLVMPVEGRDEEGTPFATVMVSRDHGATWTVGTPAYRPGSECQAVQLGDGSIMLNIRNRTGFRAVFITRDLGRTWRPHETDRTTLIEPNCNASLYRMDYRDKGRTERILLFANPHSQKNRTHHSLQLSLDDGRTWPEKYRVLLDEAYGRGYPSITRVGSSHIGIVYEGSQADLVYERIALQELLTR